MKETNMSTGQTNVHFREHDIELLQKRTKLWLETVLGETYEDRTLPELISDGNILYRVSKHIIKEMTGASPGPKDMSPRTFAHVSDLGKNSGKYLPYANVDAFLKTCKKVGLSDIELFTPPDAVEFKDIRPVCTCIRTLARKARAQHIRVPDFEDVNRPLPMPKEKVEEIKENLQHAHSSPVNPTPEAEIVKSERGQIIRRFLSATTNPLYVPEEDGASISSSEPPSPATPGPFSTKRSPLSTPTPTIGAVGAIDTPVLMKSVSAIEPSAVYMESAKHNFDSRPPSISSNEAKPDEAHDLIPSNEAKPDEAHDLISSNEAIPDEARDLLPSNEAKPDEAHPTQLPSPHLPLDQMDDLHSPFSNQTSGSFRHAHPHFIKQPASQPEVPTLADDHPVEGVDPPPEVEETFSLPEVSAPTTPAISSSDRSADRTKELPTVAQLGLGKAYRHASPHFSFTKSSKAYFTDSQDLQTQFSEAKPEGHSQKAFEGQSKAPSTDNIVDNIVGKSPTGTLQRTDVSSRASFDPAAKVPSKDPDYKPAPKASGIRLNPRHWMPLVAGAIAFLGTILLVRSRELHVPDIPDVPNVYEVKEGDTLSTISKKVGKKSWDELVRLNPSISNPNLIYPSERLRLSSS